MGTYSTEEYRELFGGDPEPGEAYLPLDAIDHLRKSERENGHHCHRALNTSPRPDAAVLGTAGITSTGRGEDTSAGGEDGSPISPIAGTGSSLPAEDHCDVCGAPRGKHHLSYCDLRGEA